MVGKIFFASASGDSGDNGVVMMMLVMVMTIFTKGPKQELI